MNKVYLESWSLHSIPASPNNLFSGIHLLDQFRQHSQISWSSYDESKLLFCILKNSQYLDYFCENLLKMLRKISINEIICLSILDIPIIKVEIFDLEWKHGPCASRALVTWDITNGQFASLLCKKKICYSSKRWQTVIEEIVSYEISANLTCKAKLGNENCIY